MTKAILALQQAVHEALVDDDDLIEMITSVFQHVPEGTALPYAAITPRSAQDWSTSTKEGQQVELEVRLYMREAGSRKILAAAEQVRVVLHEAVLSPEDFELISLRVEDVNVALGADGLTYQASIVLNAMMQEE